MWNKLAVAAVLSAALAAFAAPAWAFDARSPRDIYPVVISSGASGVWDKNDGGKGTDFIKAKAGQVSFDVDFWRCNEARTLCDLVVYQLLFTSNVTLEQLNDWNRWTTLCPAFRTKSGSVRAWMAQKVYASNTREEIARQVEDWLACASDFDKFTDGPDAFIEAHK